MRERKARKHKSDCDCIACRALNDPLAAYMLRHKDFFRLAIADDGDVPEAEENAIQQGASLLVSTAELCLLMGGVWRVMGEQAGLPGYIAMGHVTAEAELLGEPDLALLDLSDVPFADDAGLAHIRGLLDAANRARLARSQPAFNTALWISGIHSDIPLHGLVLSEDQAGGILLADRAIRPLPLRHMPRALELQRDSIAALHADQAGVTSPRDQGLLVALRGAGVVTMQLGAKLTALLARYAEALREFESTLSEQRNRITSQADARRKAAVAAKTQQLKAAQAKAQALTRQLAEAQRRIRALERTQPAPGETAPGQVPQAEDVTPAQDEVLVLDPVEPEDNDDHWRETAEHQAVVLRELRLVHRHLQGSSSQEDDEPVEVEAPPRKLAELADWAAENADRVVVLKRALHAARKGTYEDEELVFKALDMLATTYRDVKLGLADRMTYAKACEELGLEMGGSIDIGASSAYFFSWKGRKVFLDQHLGRGNARDPRYCFRCYFTWDAEEAKVIIGWLPNHLPTRAT